MFTWALPPLNVTGEPKFEPSITNWTVPVGVPEPDVTLAVNTTFCPKTDGAADEDTVVVVAAEVTSVKTVWPPRVGKPAAEIWYAP